MFSSIRLLSIIFVVIIFLVLMAFSFIKYNNNNNLENEHSQIVKQVDDGERKIFAFLNLIKKIDWLNLEKKAKIKDSEAELSKKNKINFETIDIKNMMKNNLSPINWRNIWSNYWQRHINWYNNELESIKNK
jgi:hypothetical protein